MYIITFEYLALQYQVLNAIAVIVEDSLQNNKNANIIIITTLI